MHEAHDPSVRLRTRVPNGRTAHWMLRFADAWIGHCPVGLTKLDHRYPGEAGPELVGRGEVETVMQVEAEVEATLVDLEESAKPRAVKHDHPGIAVGKGHRPVSLRSLPCVKRNSCDQEGFSRQPPDSVTPLLHEP